jgi:hypothetical protein
MDIHGSLNRTELIAAIQRVRADLTWKPGSAERHLQQRLRRRHLPATATLVDYEAIIQSVLHSRTAHMYIFWHHRVPYISLVDNVNGQSWLVMFALTGVLESAYIVERPEYYLNKPEFTYVDLLSKVMPDHDE